MYSKNQSHPRPWPALWRAPLRALLLGGSGAAATGLFTALGGAVLCLADGLPWNYAGAWGLRGAFAGLVAGTIIGVLSGVHHVDERRPRRQPWGPDESRPDKDAAEPSRPVVVTERDGVPHRV